jgi:hypothetical protein
VYTGFLVWNTFKPIGFDPVNTGTFSKIRQIRICIERSIKKKCITVKANEAKFTFKP